MNEADFETKYIDVNGVKTCYIEQGEPLILIPGGGVGANSYGNWFASLPLFAKRFRTIAIDMFGFGKSESPAVIGADYSQKTRYDYLAGFIKAMEFEKATLLGNSMGVAVEYLELVDKLILMGSAGLNSEI